MTLSNTNQKSLFKVTIVKGPFRFTRTIEAETREAAVGQLRKYARLYHPDSQPEDWILESAEDYESEYGEQA